MQTVQGQNMQGQNMQGQMPQYNQQMQGQIQGQMQGMQGMQQMPGQYNQQMPQQGMPGQYNQQGQQGKPKSNFVTCIKDNYTTISLFEFSAGFDPSEQYPQAFGFVMGVPSVPDQTKQSGKRYVPDQKIVMKFSTQELRALGQTMLDISVFKNSASPFEKFSDPSKNSYTQNGAQQGATKALKCSYDANKNNVIINISYGQQKVFIPIKDLQDTKGLGWSLINAGNFADQKLAEYIMANNIKNEIPDEVPGHVVQQEYNQPMQGGVQQMPQQGMQQPMPQYNQQMPQQGMPQQQGLPGGMPQQQMPQYNPQMQQMPGNIQ